MTTNQTTRLGVPYTLQEKEAVQRMLGYAGPVTVTATAPITAKTFVTLTGATATAGGQADGVALTSTTVGGQFSMAAAGQQATVTAGGAFTIGDNLMVGAGGVAVKQSGSGVTVAKAAGVSSGAGVEVAVLVGGAGGVATALNGAAFSSLPPADLIDIKGVLGVASTAATYPEPLTPLPAQQDALYDANSRGLGYSDGVLHINADVVIGGARNLASNTNTAAALSAINASHDATKTIKYRGIDLSRAYGSNFYSAFSLNLTGQGVALIPGKKYLLSCFVKNVSDTEKMMWMRDATSGNGHGAKLITPDVRRIWCLVQAVTATTVDQMSSPSVALGSGAATGAPPFAALCRSAESFDLRLGGLMIEQVPDSTKMGVAVIGDSTVAGASGMADLTPSSEWTRWAESMLNVPFFNRGIGGNKTSDMVTRWATDMTPLAVNAGHAIIQGGINDIGTGVALATIKTNLQTLHDYAVADGMQPIVCTCTPTSSIAANGAYEADRLALNIWIKQTFSLVFDLAGVVADPVTPSLLSQKTGWVGDGVHFGALAKRAIGIALAKWPYWDFVKPSAYQARLGNASTVDAVRYGSLATGSDGYGVVSVAGGGVVNLKSDPRFDNLVVEYTGALTAGRTVYMRAFQKKMWFIRNNTAGAFTLDVSGVDAAGVATGGSIAIAQGKGAWVLATGSGLIRASTDV